MDDTANQSVIHWEDIGNFWSQVTIPSDPAACWIWRGNNPIILRGIAYEPVHLAYRLTHPALTGENTIRHRCGNATQCVNPTHMLAGDLWRRDLDRAVRERLGKPPHHLLLYEDDRVCACQLLQEYLETATGVAVRHELQQRLALVRREQLQTPTQRRELCDEHRRLYVLWALTGAGTRKAKELEARMKEIKHQLGDLSPGVQLRTW